MGKSNAAVNFGFAHQTHPQLVLIINFSTKIFFRAAREHTILWAPPIRGWAAGCWI